MKRGRPTKKAAENRRDYNHGICNEHKKVNLDLTHADVSNAVERFKKEGGEIKKLPPSGDEFSPKYHSENLRNMQAV